MASSNNGIGCGRGGRGAGILAKLMKLELSQRPGENESKEEVKSSITCGRGALLASLCRGDKKNSEVVSDKCVTSKDATDISNTSARKEKTFVNIFKSETNTRGVPKTENVETVRPTILSKPKEKGIHGQVKKAVTNHIKLNVKKGIGVYEYEVKFSPDLEDKRQRFAALSTPDVQSVLGSTKSFDGTMLFLPHRVDDQEVHTRLSREELDVTLRLTLKRVNDSEKCVHMYNVLLKRIMGIMEMTQVGNNYYSPQNAIDVPSHKLCILPGYVTAIQDYEGGLQLEIDVSHRVLRNQTVLDIMNEMMSVGNSQTFCRDVEELLLGNVILTKYNNQTYRIDEIDWSQTPNSTFTKKDGREVTFVEYYKEVYSLKVTDTKQPILLHRKTKKELKDKGKTCLIGLVPEFSNLTGLTDSMRQDFRVMKDLARVTKLDPFKRQQSFMKFINSIQKYPAAVALLNQWGMEFSPHSIQLESRLYKPEGIMFGDGQVSAGPKADWSKDFGNKKMLVSVGLKNWIVLYSQRNENIVKTFIKTYCKLGANLGIEIQNPQALMLKADGIEVLVRTLREKITSSTQLAMVICPVSRSDRYTAIKKICCVETPVPSQVIIAKTISDERKLRSVTQKILAQINCKLGGELWHVSIPLVDTMICGVDVYHDGPKKSQSVVGFVASTNANFSRWYSKAVFQKAGEEMIESLKICLMASIRRYHKVNKGYPKTIIIYRDGVSDGQMKMIVEYEIAQLRSTFQHFSEYSPSLSVIIVQKRINTRIMSVAGNSLENPFPGTVVDHTITRKDLYDFYLVSQHVNQGTVTPSHYVVLYDDSKLTVDHMQKLSYKLTHLYYNWPGTIRVPAPCQYAHRLCYLVGQNIRQDPHELLSDRLFYL